MAMFTRWRLPPESRPPRRQRGRRGRPARASAPRPPRGSATRSRRANRRRFSRHRELGVDARAAGGPSPPRRPAARRCRRSRLLDARRGSTSSVVLPAPLGPMTATTLARMDLEAHVAAAPRARRSASPPRRRAGSPRSPRSEQGMPCRQASCGAVTGAPSAAPHDGQKASSGRAVAPHSAQTGAGDARGRAGGQGRGRDRSPGLEHEMAAQIGRGFPRHGRERQGYEGPEDPVSSPPISRAKITRGG